MSWCSRFFRMLTSHISCHPEWSRLARDCIEGWTQDFKESLEYQADTYITIFLHEILVFPRLESRRGEGGNSKLQNDLYFLSYTSISMQSFSEALHIQRHQCDSLPDLLTFRRRVYFFSSCFSYVPPLLIKGGNSKGDSIC